MLQQAILLCKSCVHFCSKDNDAAKYKMMVPEWNQATYLMQLLEPLCKASELLRALNYPTLNKVLPIYIIFIKHLKQVQWGFYDQARLIQPANLIIDKLKGYLIDALKKPAYFVAMVLNPTIKTNLWKNNKVFIVEFYKLTVNHVLDKFWLDFAERYPTNDHEKQSF